MRDTEEMRFDRTDRESAALRERLLKLQLEAARQRRHTTNTIVPRDRDSGPVPASYAQERLWFLDQMGLVGAAYNISLALRLSGSLNESALEGSFAELVRRHETLRTRFEIVNGVPTQIIESAQTLEFQRADLEEIDDPLRRESDLLVLMQREQLHQFTLAKGPLFRVMLVQLTRLEHALLITMHHIISDGWSIGVLVRELSALYAAYVRGQPSPLAELPAQYADYAIWQRQWLKGEFLENQLRYWSARLTGAPAQLQMPTDRPRPAVESFSGATRRFELPASLTGALEELARLEGATLFMVILAAFQLLLARWSGQRDIVVGSPIAGRKHREIEGLIGFFVNTLALRTELSGDLTFRQLLQRVKEATIGAYANQDLPFEKLVTELRPERNLTRQPIFQVMLALQNFPQEQLDLAGLTWKWDNCEYLTTHFDLTLYLYKVPQGLSAILEYATDLFYPETIERLTGHFATLLEGITVDPDRPILELPLLDAEQMRELLIDWNSTGAAYPRTRCVHEIFSDWVNLTPESPAVRFRGYTLSYAELDRQANRLAHHLRSLGVGPDVVVAVHLERSLEMVIGLLATMKAGGAYLPLDPSHPEERLTFLLGEAHASIVLSTEELSGRLPSDVKHVVRVDEAILFLGQPTTPPDPQTHATNLAYVLYTSGSTGRPKAVGVVHRNITRLLLETNYIQITSKDVFLQLAAPTFDASTFEIWGALLHGATLVVYPDQDVDLERLQQVIEQERVSVLWLTAGLFHRTLDERPQALSSLKWLLAGGDALSVSHVKRTLDQFPSCRLINGYGPTEATTFSVCFGITNAATLETSVPIGRPIANTRVYVLDERLQAVPVGFGGELYIAGDGLARGYLHHPESTAERFIANPFGAAGSRMYRSGDLVRWRPNGTLEFLGRVDNQVKIRGYRIEPGEIEAVLLEHPAVKQCVVQPREDSPGDRRLVCYIVGDRNGALQNAAAEKTPQKLRTAVVSEWETLYESTYGGQSPETGPSFVGWNSSFTGEAIPEPEMQEWLSSTIARIRRLQPARVLEIGCGVGLLLQQLAPECLVYVGTDFSAAALAQLQRWISGQEHLSHVDLLHRPATELQDLSAGSFDTLILNSVVQYFPDIEYLLAVLRQAIPLLTPGGKIFIGDVRHFGSLTMFHSAVQLGKASATISVGQLKKRIARAVAQDKELVIDPQFFRLLPGNLPGISSAEVHLKRGRSSNELTRYRYDVTLQVGTGLAGRTVCEPLRWDSAVGSVAKLDAALREGHWSTVQLCSIPNQRVARDANALKLITSCNERMDVGTLRLRLANLESPAVDPEEIWNVAEARGYDITVSPAELGCFEIRLLNRSDRATALHAAKPAESVRSWAAYANDPLENGFRQQLVPQLREYLQSRLPDYMIPSAWTVLKQFPLTTNGKVDRRALPAPQGRPEEMGEYVAPRNALERTLADIWTQLLPVDQVGVWDNFFELGGHSLLIVQLMERLREAGLYTNVRSVYENPTLESLARKLTTDSVPDFVAPPNLIPEGCEAITPEMLPLVALTPLHIAKIAQSVSGGITNIQDIYPLAPLQEGMLFHNLLAEDRGDAYGRSLLLMLSSREKLEDFIAALQEVIDRHDILRTAVLWNELPQPIQVVHRQATLPIEEIALDAGRDPVEQLKEWMGPANSKLRLAEAPLMRLQISPAPHGGQWYALIRTHHIVFDNESLQTMLEEVMAHVEGRARQLPIPGSYRDHVAQVLAGTSTDDIEAFFRRKLGDVDQPTAPFGLLDIHGDGRHIANARDTLDPLLARRIRTQAQRLSVSTAALLHAAWGLVVSHTSGRDDIVFGSVLLGRMQSAAATNRVLGMFINTLPLRLRLRGLTAEQLIEHTRSELAELLDYEHASLALAQRCSGVSGSSPLFSTLFNYVRRSSDIQSQFSKSPGVRLLAGRGETNYPIALTVYDQGSDFVLDMETDDRLAPRQMLDYLEVAIKSLLRALESTSQMPALALPILTDNERQQVISLFNATRAPLPDGKLIHELFEEQVQRIPGSIAVVCEGRSLTFAELNANANKLARYLISRGAGPDRLVGVCIERSLEMVVGWLGILKAGGAYVPLDPAYPLERLIYMVRDSAPHVLLTQQSLANKLDGLDCEVLPLDTNWIRIAQESDANLEPRALQTRSHHLAYAIYTSGSTGKPKGAMIEHRNVIAFRQGLENAYRAVPGCQRVALNASFNFDGSVQQLVQLLNGRTLYIVSEVCRRDTALLLQFVDENAIDAIDATPSQLKSWISQGLLTKDGKRPRLIFVGGEAIDQALWQTLARAETIEFFNVYGPTECTVDATFTRLKNDLAGPHIGRPMENRRLYILGPGNQPAPLGVTGEIYVGGAGVGRGYLNRPELTLERFMADPFAPGHDARMYRTGDLGRWRADGNIEYLGRNDQQVKIRGYRIELGEIESQLAKHPNVKDAVVIASEATPDEQLLVAYVTAAHATTTAGSPNGQELREYLRELLPEYMVPSAFVTLDRFPTTPSGKLDRRALPAPDLQAFTTQEYDPPQGHVEEMLTELWQEFLQLKRIGRRDNFFDLGGHSLLVLRFLVKVNQTFKSTLTIADVYRNPVLSDLAIRLGSGGSADEFVDLVREARLDDDIRATAAGLRASPKAIFLTGSTGFVGRFLLAQLLRDTDATVHCLVRAQSHRQALTRLRNTLVQWDLWQEEFSNRLVAIPGDLGMRLLGTGEDTFASLSEDIDTIYHCATSMNHLESYATAKRTNVEAAKDLIRLASRGRPKLVNYISTLSIFAGMEGTPDRIVDEETPIENELHPTSQGYVASKWVAEKLFMTARARSIPCNVFRVGLVWADTDQGRYDELQREYRVFKSCLLSGLGIENYRFGMAPTPVDYAARAIAFLGTRTGDGGGNFHISSSDQLPSGLFERCNEIANTSLELLPIYEWITEMKRLQSRGLTLPIVPLIEYAFSMNQESFLEHQRKTFSQQVRFDCNRTRRELERAGIFAPSLDDRLLQVFLSDIQTRDPDLRVRSNTVDWGALRRRLQ